MASGNVQQLITWTNDALVYWTIYVPTNLDELQISTLS